MEAVPRLFMLSFELKISSQNSDFATPLKRFVRSHYQEEPDSYSKEIRDLEVLRHAAIKVPTDFTGCSILKRYYSQLILLQNRFPMTDEGPACVPFTWTDIYSGSTFTITDIKYEQACILYNIGALHSQLGALDSRSNDEGMKMTCTHFQCAEWAFHNLRDAYPQPKGSDLSHNILSFMMSVMLAQAQECILEKSMLDNRKSSITAKVAIQVVDYYRAALVILVSTTPSKYTVLDVVGSKQFKYWKKYVQFKMSYYTCVSHYFMGNQSEEQQKMGERVSWFQSASEHLAEATKIAKSIDREDLNESILFLVDVIGGKHNISKKENDFVYHEKVLPTDSLPEIKGASLVKGISFNPTDPDVCGLDIFARLVPMEAHSSSSVYSEEKAKILRSVGARMEQRNEELSTYLSSLHVDHSILNEQEEIFPTELIEKCAALSVTPTALSDLTEMMEELTEISKKVDSDLSSCSNLVAVEEKKDRDHQEMFGKSAPSMILLDLKKEFLKFDEAHKKATEANRLIESVVESHVENLKKLQLPIEELKMDLPSVNAKRSSLDGEELRAYKKLLAKIEEMQKQRSFLEKQLREDLQNDDITKRIVAVDNKNDMQSVFEDELKKHNQCLTYIDQNLSAQDNILHALTEANASFADVRKTLSATKQEREMVIQSLIASHEAYEDLLEKVRNGLEFYQKLKGNVSRLLDRMKSVTKVQDEERIQRVGAQRPSVVIPPQTSLTRPIGAPKLKDFLPFMTSQRAAFPPDFLPVGTTAASAFPPDILPVGATATSTLPPGIHQTMQPPSPSNSVPRPNVPYMHRNVHPSTMKTKGMENQTPQLYSVPTPPSFIHNQFPSRETSPTVPMPNQIPSHSKVLNNQVDMTKRFLGDNPAHIQSPYQHNITPTSNISAQLDNAYSSNKLNYPGYPANVTMQGNVTPMQQATVGNIPTSQMQAMSMASHPGTSILNTQYATSVLPANGYMQSQTTVSQQAPKNVAPLPVTMANSASQPFPNVYGSQPPLNNTHPNSYPNNFASYPSSVPATATTIATYSQPPGHSYSNPQSGVNYYSGAQQVAKSYPASIPEANVYGTQLSVNIQPNTQTLTNAYPNTLPATHIHSGSIPAANIHPSSLPSVNVYPGTQPAVSVYGGPTLNAYPSTQPTTVIQPHSQAMPNIYGAPQPMQNAYPSSQPTTVSDANFHVPVSTQANVFVGGQVPSMQKPSASVPPVNNTYLGSQAVSTPGGIAESFNESGRFAPVSYAAHNYSTPVLSYPAVPTSGTTQISSSNTPLSQSGQSITPHQQNYTTASVSQVASNTLCNVPHGNGLQMVEAISSQQLQPLTPIPAKIEPPASVSNGVSKSVPTSNASTTSDKVNGTPKSYELSNNILPDFDPHCQTKNEMKSVPDSTTLTNELAKQNEVTILNAKSKDSTRPKDPLDDPVVLDRFSAEVEKFEKLVDGLVRKSLNGTMVLDQKWKDLAVAEEKDSRKMSISVARCCPMKNRVPDIMPYDHNRVKLSTCKDDYINASYLKDLLPTSPTYIITQAPLPATFCDFWMMVWEQQVENIVCLLSCNELKSHIYWPQERGKTIPFGVLDLSLQSQKVDGPCTERIISISHNKNKTSRVVVHLQFDSWQPSKLPNVEDLLKFISLMLNFHRQQRSLQRPLVVHCSAGVGRSGAFCLITTMAADMNKGHGPKDVVQVTAHMFQQRKFIILDKDHLKFCYHVVLSYAQKLLSDRGVLLRKLSFSDKPNAVICDSVTDASTAVKTQAPDDFSNVTDSPPISLCAKSLSETVDACSVLADPQSNSDCMKISRRSSDSSIRSIPEVASLAETPDIEVKSEGTKSPITSVLDPTKFTLDSPGLSSKQRITKDMFTSSTGNLSNPNQDSSDPLSTLDPMWSLKK